MTEDAKGDGFVRKMRLRLERLVELALLGHVEANRDAAPELRRIKERARITGLESGRGLDDDVAGRVEIQDAVSRLELVFRRRHRLVAGRHVNLGADHRARFCFGHFEVTELLRETRGDGGVGERGRHRVCRFDLSGGRNRERDARLAAELLVFVGAEGVAANHFDPMIAARESLHVGRLVRAVHVRHVDDYARHRVALRRRHFGDERAHAAVIPAPPLGELGLKDMLVFGQRHRVELVSRLDLDLNLGRRRRRGGRSRSRRRGGFDGD